MTCLLQSPVFVRTTSSFSEKRATKESINTALRRNYKISRTSSNRITMLTRRHLTTTPTDKSVLTRAHTNFVATRILWPRCRSHIRAVSARLREISNRLATDSPRENGTETGTDWNGNKAPDGVDAGVRDHP